MEIDVCVKCGKEVYSSIDGVFFCTKHYVENYGRDKRFLGAELNKFLDYLSRESKFTVKEKEFLKEVKRQFPEVVEEFHILFKNLS